MIPDPFKNFNMPNLFMTNPGMLSSLLDPKDLQQIESNANKRGLVTSLLSWAGMPKNQNLGSAFAPQYVAQAILPGFNQAQNYVDTTTQGMINLKTLKRLDESQKTNLQKLQEYKQKLMEDPEGNAGLIEQVDNQIKYASTGGSPYYNPVVTDKGIMIVNARTGTFEPMKDSSGNILSGAQYSPDVKRELAAANVEGEDIGKKSVTAKGASDLIKDARMILTGIDPSTGEKAPLPTGSAFGKIQDVAGALVGKSVEGASQAAQLKVIAGNMVAKVPRMEGPQSDIDVQNYKEMAGKVGDDSLPIETRLAALAQAEKIMTKYEKLNQPEDPRSKLSGKLLDAYDWAMSHPDDPRSKQILNKLGI